MDISIFGSDPPTQPPNMDKTKKTWWVVAELDVGGSSGCQRLAVVSGVVDSDWCCSGGGLR